jgi:hypothetical protein
MLWPLPNKVPAQVADTDKVLHKFLRMSCWPETAAKLRTGLQGEESATNLRMKPKYASGHGCPAVPDSHDRIDE